MSGSNGSQTIPNSRKPCRVLIADDHAMVRAAMRRLLEAAPDITVVAEAADGQEALEKINESAPDVAIVDVAMPKLMGIELTRRVTVPPSPTRVVAMSGFEDEDHARKALAAGAAGFLPKSAAGADFVAAIQAVAAGGRYLHPKLTRLLIAPARQPRRSDALSEREEYVLRHVAYGFSNKEIANGLGVTAKTVETYKARAMKKLSISSRAEVVRYAMTQAWFSDAKYPSPLLEARR